MIYIIGIVFIIVLLLVYYFSDISSNSGTPDQLYLLKRSNFGKFEKTGKLIRKGKGKKKLKKDIKHLSGKSEKNLQKGGFPPPPQEKNIHIDSKKRTQKIAIDDKKALPENPSQVPKTKETGRYEKTKITLPGAKPNKEPENVREGYSHGVRKISPPLPGGIPPTSEMKTGKVFWENENTVSPSSTPQEATSQEKSPAFQERGKTIRVENKESLANDNPEIPVQTSHVSESPEVNESTQSRALKPEINENNQPRALKPVPPPPHLETIDKHFAKSQKIEKKLPRTKSTDKPLFSHKKASDNWLLWEELGVEDVIDDLLDIERIKSKHRHCAPQTTVPAKKEPVSEKFYQQAKDILAKWQLDLEDLQERSHPQRKSGTQKPYKDKTNF